MPTPAVVVAVVVAVAGGRGAAEADAAFSSVDFSSCFDGKGFDVAVIVNVAGAGSTLGVEERLAVPGSWERVSLPCVRSVVEGVVLSDRGREPPTAVLLRLTDAEAPAPLPLVEIGRAIRRTEGDAIACVNRLRKRHPELKGKATARLVVDGDGDVVTSSFSGEAPGLVDCVRDAARAFHVEGLGGPRELVVTYTFEQKQPQAYEDPLRHRSLGSFLGCL